jgi:hypothetical protein
VTATLNFVLPAALISTLNDPLGTFADTVVPDPPLLVASTDPVPEMRERVALGAVPLTYAVTAPPAVVSAKDLLPPPARLPLKLVVVTAGAGTELLVEVVIVGVALLDGGGGGADDGLALGDGVGLEGAVLVGDGANPVEKDASALAASTRPVATTPAASGSVL